MNSEFQEMKKAVEQVVTPKYATENGSRAARMRNIAAGLLALHEQHPDQAAVTTSRLREFIREQLQMPALEGEAQLGDLKAHGDAIGGHGLHLEVSKESGMRVVKFSDQNLTRCKQFLETGAVAGILC
jgi:hypothetical protein